MKDRNHPFFRPLWRRIAIVVVCLVWAGVEWFGGDPTWSILTLGIAAYSAWTFLLRYDPAPEPASEAVSPVPPSERSAP